MVKNNNVKNVLNGLVMLIGVYMIYLGWGGITPPLLSGVAFILIGITNCSLIKL